MAIENVDIVHYIFQLMQKFLYFFLWFLGFAATNLNYRWWDKEYLQAEAISNC